MFPLLVTYSPSHTPPHPHGTPTRSHSSTCVPHSPVPLCAPLSARNAPVSPICHVPRCPLSARVPPKPHVLPSPPLSSCAPPPPRVPPHPTISRSPHPIRPSISYLLTSPFRVCSPHLRPSLLPYLPPWPCPSIPPPHIPTPVLRTYHVFSCPPYPICPSGVSPYPFCSRCP